MSVEKLLLTKVALPLALRKAKQLVDARKETAPQLMESMEALRKNPANHAFVEKMAESLGVLDAGEPAKQRIDFSAVRPKHKTTPRGPKHHFTKG